MAEDWNARRKSNLRMEKQPWTGLWRDEDVRVMEVVPAERRWDAQRGTGLTDGVKQRPDEATRCDVLEEMDIAFIGEQRTPPVELGVRHVCKFHQSVSLGTAQPLCNFLKSFLAVPVIQLRWPCVGNAINWGVPTDAAQQPLCQLKSRAVAQ